MYRKDNTVYGGGQSLSGFLYSPGETIFLPPPFMWKEAMTMNITLTELFEFCLVIIGIISLCIQAKKK